MGRLGTTVSQETDFSAASTSESNAKLAVGGYAGANYQIGSWVLGIEVDSSRDEMEAAGSAYSARGRMGYALGPALLYATGGLAWRDRELTWISRQPMKFPAGRVSYSALAPVPAGSTVTEQHETSTGFVLGLGVEYKLSQNIAIRTEVLRSDYQAVKFVAPGNATTATVTADSLAARFGFTIMFP
jgi:outer membrane immunogenic protein